MENATVEDNENALEISNWLIQELSIQRKL